MFSGPSFPGGLLLAWITPKWKQSSFFLKSGPMSPHRSDFCEFSPPPVLIENPRPLTRFLHIQTDAAAFTESYAYLSRIVFARDSRGAASSGRPMFRNSNA
jgi:hypothetical protein